MYNIVIQYFYTWHDHSQSNYHLLSHIVIIILLTRLLYCTLNPVSFITSSLQLLIPFAYFAHFLPPPSLETTCLFSEPVSVFMFTCFFTYVPHKWNHMVIGFLSDLFHLPDNPPGPPILLQMARFYSCLWLKDITLYNMFACVLSGRPPYLLLRNLYAGQE